MDVSSLSNLLRSQSTSSKAPAGIPDGLIPKEKPKISEIHTTQVQLSVDFMMLGTCAAPWEKGVNGFVYNKINLGQEAGAEEAVCHMVKQTMERCRECANWHMKCLHEATAHSDESLAA